MIIAYRGLAIQSLRVALFAALLGGFVLLFYRMLPLTDTFWERGLPIPYQFPDSEYYIATAQGKIDTVPSPYSRRVLMSVLAGAFAKYGHVSLPYAFTAINYAAFILLAYLSSLILVNLGVSSWWTICFLLTPSPLESLQRAYLPDLFHMTLVSAILALLIFRRDGWALALLFVAYLTRDNTLILCITFVTVGWYLRQRTLLAGGGAVLFAGMAMESWFVHLGQPNNHHIPEFIFTACSVLASFFGNVLGIVVWTNTTQLAVEPVPFFHWHIPPSLHFGADHDAYVGYSGFRVLETLAALVTLFGCGPFVVAYLFKEMVSLKKFPIVVQVVIIYGVISYFLGTSVGRTGTFRLIAYSWPLFWIGLPYLFSRAHLPLQWREAVLLALTSLLVAWLPNLTHLTGCYHIVSAWLLYIPLLYLATAISLSRIRRRGVATNG